MQGPFNFEMANLYLSNLDFISQSVVRGQHVKEEQELKLQ